MQIVQKNGNPIKFNTIKVVLLFGIDTVDNI